MMKPIKTITTAAFLILFALFLMPQNIQAQSEEEKATIIKAGDTCPSFSYVDAEGKSHKIESKKGKTVLLVFFATWCGPCRNELKAFNDEILPPFKDHPDFEIIILGREHTQEEVTKFKTEHQYFMPFFADPKREIYSLFATAYIPRTFVIDKKGKIIFAEVGFTDEKAEKLSQIIESSLK